MNDAQRAAVQATSGPLVILAGAGTGKTRVISRRAAYAIETGVVPASRILLVTFTDKAATEMVSRMAALGHPGVMARPFHSHAVRQLRHFWPSHHGGDDPPQILDSKLPLIRPLVGRLRQEQAEHGPFVRVHVAPRTAAEVADEDEVALVVLGPDAPHTTRSEQSPSLAVADTLLNERGTAPRQNRNMLVFMAADQTRLAELEEAVRQYLAWKSIEADLPTLTIDSFQERQVRTKVTEANETVAVRLPEAYQWLLVPEQPDPNGSVSWRATRLSGTDRLVPRAGRKLTGEDLLLTKMSGTYLRLQLDRVPAIWESGEVTLRQLWSYFTSYLYMPRLKNSAVLLEAVADGAGLMWHENFAYAAGKDAGGRYLGLSVGRQPDVILDAHSLIVRPELADEQLRQERDEAERERREEPEQPTDGDEGGVIAEPPMKVARRFYGSIQLDPSRPTPQFSQVAEEVISRLAGLADVNVKVRVDIEASSDGEGFSDATVRTVTENAKTLKFSNAGFEDD